MSIIKEYKKIDISEITAYERNNKKHGKNVERIADSIARNEYIAPIIVDEDNIILAGHGRKLALESLGEKEVEVLQVSGLTKKQKADFRIADNRTTELSEWDFEAVLQEIEEFELEELKIDFPDLEFERDDLDEEKEDEVPAMDNVEIIVEKGDIFQLGEHRLMCNDMTDVKNIEELIDGVKINMIYADPPYGMFLDTDYSKMPQKFDKGRLSSNKFETVIGDAEDFDPRFITTLLDLRIKETFLWGADYYCEIFSDIKNLGSWVIWDKCGGGEHNEDKMFGSNFETCWSKNRHKRELARIKWKGVFGMEQDDTKNRVHPTQKPAILAEWFFDKRGKDGDNILDTFLGSGSTLIACEKTNRKCYGMELDPKYIQVILKRYYDYTKGSKEIKCLTRDLDLTPILDA